MFRKFLQHLRRVANARRFGIAFTRRASFVLPTTIQLGGKSIPVSSPAEHGAAIDFLTCFIEDEYGLRDVGMPVQTIADIGANIGFFSMAAKSYFPGATIHAYEPNPRILPHCFENAAAAQFQVFGEAVGAQAGFVSIEDSGDSNQARTVSSKESGSRVSQVSLGTVVERLGGTVDLAKVDCEGAEWELFEDAGPWAHIAQLRMEYHLWGRHTFADVDQALRKIGFTILYHRPAGEWGTVWARNTHA
jgi:FkbM family methyltransferase